MTYQMHINVISLRSLPRPHRGQSSVENKRTKAPCRRHETIRLVYQWIMWRTYGTRNVLLLISTKLLHLPVH